MEGSARYRYSSVGGGCVAVASASVQKVADVSSTLVCLTIPRIRDRVPHSEKEFGRIVDVTLFGCRHLFANLKAKISRA